MNVSIDFDGCYTEHKDFFDTLARGMQLQGHKVGIITGMREIDAFTKVNNRQKILTSLGFVPDFCYLWGEFETIANGNLWKCERMDQENVIVHFDDDATEMKKYTDRWIIKVLNSAQPAKF